MPEEPKNPESAGILIGESEPPTPGVVSQRLTLFSSFGVILIASLGLIGWMSGHTVLASVRPGYIPMAPSTAVCFLLLASALLMSSKAPSRRIVSHFMNTLVLVVMVFTAFEVIAFFGIYLDVEDLIFPQSGTLHGIPLGKMSPLTGGFFFLSALSMLLSTGSSRLPQGGLFNAHLSGLLASTTILGGFTTLLSYLYGTPLLYSSDIIPMAVTTAAAFLALGIGITTTLPRRAIPLTFFLGGSTSAHLVRIFVPLVVVAVIGQGFIHCLVVMVWNINNALLSASLAVVVALLFGAIAFFGGSRVGVRLDEAESKLRISEERFRLAMELAEEGLWDWDITTGEVFYSTGWNKLLGYPVSEANSTLDFWKSRLHPEDRLSTLALVKSFLKGETTSFECEHRLQTKDGQWIWVLGKGSAVARDAKGRALRVAGTMVDVTERKKGEEALLQSEERYRALFETAGDAIFLLDAEGAGAGRIVSANETAAEMHGYTVDELLTMRISDLDSPESAARVAERLERLLRTGSLRVEATHVKKDGTIFPVDINASLLELGGHKFVMAIDRDITDRRMAEESLRKAHDALDAFFNATSDIFVLQSKDGRLLMANRALSQRFGLEPADIVGKSLYDLFPRDLASSRLEKSEEVFRTGTSVQFEDTREGRHFENRVYPVRDSAGDVYAVAVVARDVTVRKQAEKERESLRNQLLQAQKMEAVGTLAGGVAHDFNNILQVAIGYSELILGDEDLSVRCRADLEKISESARRGADLVKRLLTLSRKMEIAPQPLNLNHRINEMRKILERAIPKMIDIQLVLAEDLALINADATQIDQVLMNLAVNARDAMPEGGKLIIETANVFLDEDYAKAYVDAKPGPYVLLTVSDTGEGMGRDTLEHIFEPFFTTKEFGKGTGLGLAMVHGIVQQHGGQIRCYSEPGEGTTFKIYFPALLSEEERNKTTVSAAPRGGSETILLVDDEQMIRDLCSRFLAKAGYKVITASNGKEALQVYRARHDEISLVILDLIMPEMGGKQCLESLLSLDPSLKAVIASGYSASYTPGEALALGAKGFVNKPYDMRQVMEVVRRVLDTA